MTELIPNSEQYCQDFDKVEEMYMSLQSSDGTIICAKYNSKIKYADAIRPTLYQNEYRCQESGMVLCPGDQVKQVTYFNQILSD